MIQGIIGFFIGVAASLIAMRIAGCEDDFMSVHDHDSEYLKPVTKDPGRFDYRGLKKISDNAKNRKARKN